LHLALSDKSPATILAAFIRHGIIVEGLTMGNAILRLPEWPDKIANHVNNTEHLRRKDYSAIRPRILPPRLAKLRQLGGSLGRIS